MALAAVMSLNPEVVIFDEPFAGLDRHSRDELVRFLAELKGAGKTLIIASHNGELLSALTDRRVDMA